MSGILFFIFASCHPLTLVLTVVSSKTTYFFFFFFFFFSFFLFLFSFFFFSFFFFTAYWGSWSSWGSCSRSCGSGVKYRSRSCYGIGPCSGSSSQSSSCNFGTCRKMIFYLTALFYLPRLQMVPVRLLDLYINLTCVYCICSSIDVVAFISGGGGI